MPAPAPRQATEPDVEQRGSANPCVHPQGPVHRIAAALKSWFHVRQVAGNLTRDFSARERTYLSWVKISIVLGGIGAVMMVKLDSPDDGASSSPGLPGPPVLSSNWSSTLSLPQLDPPPALDLDALPRAIWMARQVALRRSQSRRAAMWVRQVRREGEEVRPENSPPSYAGPVLSTSPGQQQLLLHQHQRPLLVPVPEPAPAHEGRRTRPPRWRAPTAHGRGAPHGILPSIAASLLSGTVYFLQALIALIIGLADYLRTERALEKIDEINESEQRAKRALEAHTAALRSAVRDGARASAHRLSLPMDPGAALPPPPACVPRLHDEDIARARSGYLVDFVTGLLILLGTIIAASAILLIIEEA